MTVLKNLFSPSKTPTPGAAGPETAPVKMNLDERMEFRREMLYEAVKVTMQAHGILSASYKFRVMRIDKRGHQYLVMVDLSTDFLHNREGRPEQLAALGSAIAKNAAVRYDLLVMGVYWKVNEHIRGFEPSRPAALRSEEAVPAPAPAPSRPPPVRRERATAEELAAFEDAWQKGRALQIGDRVYSSELAPLEDGSQKD
ncbi:MAG: hypothetical protein JF626_13380 [Polaromonas sp.]|nr:hypothetical protein [Polaromonas sp.]